MFLILVPLSPQEFDAIARRRGGSGGKGDQGDAGVARDSVVNQ